ncbi:MAG: protein translocase subunit SecF [Alphaproteobacteria bacterium]|nr:protein translocase subunit SecF [Alphaproteobacteria bacterium]
MQFPIRFLDKVPKFDFIGNRWYGLMFTIIGMLVTAGSLYTQGLNFGIDFTGGVVMEIRTEQKADLAKLRQIISDASTGEAMLQEIGSNHEVMIRLAPQKGMEQSKIADGVRTLINEKYGEKVEFLRVDYVGPQVGDELIEGSIIAITAALVMMMLYLWFRFEWQFGAGGILALMHDTVMMVGFFSVTQIEFNLTSVAAILTVIGYSINDSVVIYDRVRENLRKYKTLVLNQLLNQSINETLSRTILTGGTVLLALIGLVTLGGDVLFGFSAAMIFGVVVGTYSSVYVSATLLIYMNLRREEAVRL